MLWANLEPLKEEGHRLLDEYKGLARVNSAKAYAALEVRMKGKTGHFGQMHDKQTINLAIGNLKKMIAHQRYENSKVSV